MTKIKKTKRIIFLILISISLIIAGTYILEFKIASNQLIHQLLGVVDTIDLRILIGLTLFILTLMISLFAKHVIDSILAYKASQEKEKNDRRDDAAIAHRFFLSEKQKIKDAMFKDYMKHQRK